MDLLNYIDNFKDDNKVKAQWRVHDNKFIVAIVHSTDWLGLSEIMCKS